MTTGPRVSIAMATVLKNYASLSQPHYHARVQKGQDGLSAIENKRASLGMTVKAKYYGSGWRRCVITPRLIFSRAAGRRLSSSRSSGRSPSVASRPSRFKILHSLAILATMGLI